MKSIDWTKDELLAYILLFAANADFKETANEQKLILSKVDIDTFLDIKEEFDNDNDYQGLKKIMTSLEQHHYGKDDIDILIEDIKVLFFVDDEYTVLEQNMLLALKRLFKAV